MLSWITVCISAESNTCVLDINMCIVLFARCASLVSQSLDGISNRDTANSEANQKANGMAPERDSASSRSNA